VRWSSPQLGFPSLNTPGVLVPGHQDLRRLNKGELIVFTAPWAYGSTRHQTSKSIRHHRKIRNDPFVSAIVANRDNTRCALRPISEGVPTPKLETVDEINLTLQIKEQGIIRTHSLLNDAKQTMLGSIHWFCPDLAGCRIVARAR
jgi:hypothetical protein